MRKFLATAGALALASGAMALDVGESVYNPDITGSGLPGDGGPYYNDVLPAWLVPGNIAASLTSPISGIPGFMQFSGTVDSAAYFLNGVDESGGIGISYRINLDGNSASNLVRGSIKSDNWLNTIVDDAGSDGSGSSSAATGSVVWSDGDPYFIERDPITGSPQWTFRIGPNGTTLNAGDTSALVWFATQDVGFKEASIGLIDGGAAGAARIITIPEPATISLLGLAGLALIRRR